MKSREQDNWIMLVLKNNFFNKIFLLTLLLTSCTITANVVREPSLNIEVYFCPRNMCKEKIMALIDSASEIKCAFYDLNLPDMIKRLSEKKADVVIEDSNKIEEFSTGNSEALMHNKFCIFDNMTVFTGSMNPTIRDNYYNNNNIVIIEETNKSIGVEWP